LIAVTTGNLFFFARQKRIFAVHILAPAICSDIALLGVANDTPLNEARNQTLSFFHAPPARYECIFTAGASAALDLLARAFPWQEGSWFLPTVVNHTCVAFMPASDWLLIIEIS
jgi:hypothetical protein